MSRLLTMTGIHRRQNSQSLGLFSSFARQLSLAIVAQVVVTSIAVADKMQHATSSDLSDVGVEAEPQHAPAHLRQYRVCGFSVLLRTWDDDAVAQIAQMSPIGDGIDSTLQDLAINPNVLPDEVSTFDGTIWGYDSKHCAGQWTSFNEIIERSGLAANRSLPRTARVMGRSPSIIYDGIVNGAIVLSEPETSPPWLVTHLHKLETVFLFTALPVVTFTDWATRHSLSHPLSQDLVAMPAGWAERYTINPRSSRSGGMILWTIHSALDPQIEQTVLAQKSRFSTQFESDFEATLIHNISFVEVRPPRTLIPVNSSEISLAHSDVEGIFAMRPQHVREYTTADASVVSPSILGTTTPATPSYYLVYGLPIAIAIAMVVFVRYFFIRSQRRLKCAIPPGSATSAMQ